MKILHISGAKGWGGNEQQIIYIIPQIEDLCVSNLVFGIKDSVLESECIKNNISFIGVKKSGINKLLSLWILAKVIKTHKPDIVHLHTSDSLTFYLIFNFIFRFKVKTVFSKKGMGVSSSYLSVLKYNSSQIDLIICVSNSVRDSFGEKLASKNKNKLVVVNDCVSVDVMNETTEVDLRKLYNIRDDKIIIANIANHTNAKDLYTFIDVLCELKNVYKREDIVFFQIGEFTKKTDMLKQYAIDKKVLKNIVFFDKFKNASLLNPQFNAFLLTSQREGGPTSLLEAMLFGIPVIATNVGIVSDIIIDGKNGFVSDIKDYKSIALKIISLLDDENLQRQFAREGIEIINNRFTAKFIAQKTLEEYKKLLPRLT